MGTNKQQTDIVARKIPATGHVGIEFKGLDVDVRLEPPYAIALIDRALYHLMERGVDEPATVHSGSTGNSGRNRVWTMRADRRTPHYTTRWEDMPVARA